MSRTLRGEELSLVTSVFLLVAVSSSSFQPERYGPVWAALLHVDRRRPLDAGRRDAALAARLDALDIDQAFAPAVIVDTSAASACLAGAWLLADDLDASHHISQQLATRAGSYWHGVMHRREGDFANAKYWFRQAGSIAPLDALGSLDTIRRASDHRLAACCPWRPTAFVDACQSAVGAPGLQSACQEVQQAEWEALFDYCYHGAIGP